MWGTGKGGFILHINSGVQGAERCWQLLAGAKVGGSKAVSEQTVEESELQLSFVKALKTGSTFCIYLTMKEKQCKRASGWRRPGSVLLFVLSARVCEQGSRQSPARVGSVWAGAVPSPCRVLVWWARCWAKHSRPEGASLGSLEWSGKKDR